MGRSRLWKDSTKPSSPNENFEERVVRRAGTARHHAPRVAMPSALPLSLAVTTRHPHPAAHARSTHHEGAPALRFRSGHRVVARHLVAWRVTDRAVIVRPQVCGRRGEHVLAGVQRPQAGVLTESRGWMGQLDS